MKPELRFAAPIFRDLGRDQFDNPIVSQRGWRAYKVRISRAEMRSLEEATLLYVGLAVSGIEDETARLRIARMLLDALDPRKVRS